MLLPAVANAHLVNTGLGPFYDGVSHFALTPEDVLSALAMALLAGLSGVRAGRLVLLALPGAWLAGGFAGLTWPTSAAATALSAASFLLLGGLVAVDARLRPAWVVTVAIALGLVHGYFNGSAMAEAKLDGVGLVGIVSALFVTTALGAALVVALRAPWTRIAVRVAGSLDRRGWPVAAGLVAARSIGEAQIAVAGESGVRAKQVSDRSHLIEEHHGP